MPAGERPDRRYQLVFGNDYTDGDYAYYLDYELQWYDHWLKGIHNGVGTSDATLRIQQQGGHDAWVAPPNGTFPMTRHYTPYYLGPGGTLTQAAPAAGTDTLQWGPQQALTYTGPVLKDGATLAGPVTATIYLASSTPDAEIIATLEDVAPDGTTSSGIPLLEADGVLDGRARSVDPARSWSDDAGRLISPFHPFSSQAEQDVTPGQVLRYDIEMQPQMWSVQPDHRLRLVLSTNDPSVIPTQPQRANLAGGTYAIQQGPSFVNLPLMPLNAFPRVGDPRKVGLGDPPPAKTCISRRVFTIRVGGPSARSARVTYAGRRALVRRRHGRLTARIDLRGLAKRVVRVRIAVRRPSGRRVTTIRVFHTCARLRAGKATRGI